MEKEMVVEINMPYFKQGDDMAHCLESAENNVSKALDMYAEVLSSASNLVSNINAALREMGAEDKVEIDADTHMIVMTGPEEVLQTLLDKDLVSLSPFFDEEEEYCD